MKIRTSFVSNSSSSSFILIISGKTYDEKLPTFSPLQRDLLEWVKEPGEIDGLPLVIIKGNSGESGNTFDQYELGDGNTGYQKGQQEEDEEYLDDVFNEAIGSLKKCSCYYNSDYF